MRAAFGYRKSGKIGNNVHGMALIYPLKVAGWGPSI